MSPLSIWENNFRKIQKLKLEKIITLASYEVRIRFLAMVRSLRYVGSELPVWVIPYNNNLFDLPDGCEWWEQPEISSWVRENKLPNLLKKYQVLTTENYQFVDTDVIFQKNPSDVLKNRVGFITSCGHWHNPNHSITTHSEELFKKKSTTWQMLTFNSGQFACDRALYSSLELINIAESNKYKETLMHCPVDQPAINLFVLLSGIKIHNLTLPPRLMQSTWSGDYPKEYKNYWQTENETPYLIHWAGNTSKIDREIDQLFIEHLSDDEIAEVKLKIDKKKKNLNFEQYFKQKAKILLKVFIP